MNYPTRFPLPGSQPLRVPDAQRSEPCDPQQLVEFAVLLRPRSDAVSNLEPWGPGSLGMAGGPGRGLSEEELLEYHAAHDEDLEALEAFAAEHKLVILDRDPISRVVVLQGVAAAVEPAFDVELHQYETGDCSFRSHQEPISVPAELYGRVIGVFGLEDRGIVQPSAVKKYFGNTPAGEMNFFAQQQGGEQVPPSPQDPPSGRAFYPPQIAEIYDFPKNKGEGASIALIELGGGYDPDEMRTYFEDDLGFDEMPSIVDVGVAGGGNNPGENEPADVEVSLDIQVAASVAPGAEIVVYFAPPSSYGFLRALQVAVHGPRRHDAISISWSGPEASQNFAILVAVHQVLREAAVRGIPVFVAAGDRGSADSSPFFPADGFAHVGFPGSSPYSIACGGTSVTVEEGILVDEVVWKDEGAGDPGGDPGGDPDGDPGADPDDPGVGSTDFAGATGGGVSRVFPVPPYQSWLGLWPRSANPWGGFGRGTPDVAGHADPAKGYIIRLGGKLQVYGGTSAVAPLWAALVARMNEELGARLPALHPYLYALRGYGFRDITSGDNDTAEFADGYRAWPGFDLCTGWGSPHGEELLEAMRRFGFGS